MLESRERVELEDERLFLLGRLSPIRDLVESPRRTSEAAPFNQEVVVQKPAPDLIEAAERMIKECMEQIDGDLANSILDLAPPNHPLNIWGEGKGEQVVVMSGKLNGHERFDAICVFTLGQTATVSINFKTGQHQNKRCSIPCGRADHVWKPTLTELRWDDEAT